MPGARHAMISRIFTTRMHKELWTEPELAIYLRLTPTFLHYLLLNLTCPTSLVTPATVIQRCRRGDFDRETRDLAFDTFCENDNESWHTVDQFPRGEGKQPQMTPYHMQAFLGIKNSNYKLPDTATTQIKQKQLSKFNNPAGFSGATGRNQLPFVISAVLEAFQVLSPPLRDVDVLEFLRLCPSRSPEYGIL